MTQHPAAGRQDLHAGYPRISSPGVDGKGAQKHSLPASQVEPVWPHSSGPSSTGNPGKTLHQDVPKKSLPESRQRPLQFSICASDRELATGALLFPLPPQFSFSLAASQGNQSEEGVWRKGERWPRVEATSGRRLSSQTNSSLLLSSMRQVRFWVEWGRRRCWEASGQPVGSFKTQSDLPPDKTSSGPSFPAGRILLC